MAKNSFTLVFGKLFCRLMPVMKSITLIKYSPESELVLQHQHIHHTQHLRISLHPQDMGHQQPPPKNKIKS